jgi:superfamily I DNA/RNA helicase
MEAADILGPQYDAIIVDEGQDFRADWWVPLQCLLEDPDRGILYIFYDDNQNLFRTAFALPPGLPRFPLTHNCRNTRHIHRTFIPFSRSEVAPEVIGPEGRPTEIIYYENEHDLKQIVRRALHRLIVEEALKTEDIVILTPRARDKSLLWSWESIGNFRLTDKWPPGSNEVYCTTPYQFKGLESPVVLLVEIYPSSNQDLETLLYVGCSRARNHLIVVAEEELPADIRERLPARA